MKTKLLFTKKTKTFFSLLVFCLCLNYGFSQTELVLNGTCDLFTVTSDDATANGWTRNDSDNADAWDMTPNSSVIFDAEAMSTGATSPSPYVFWKNDALEDALELKYLGAAGSLDEQPGSTSSGNNGTRGVKLYMDTSPSLPGLSSRRLYQKVMGLTIGTVYNFSIDSRSEAANTPSEVYMLNTEIQDEDAIDFDGGVTAMIRDGYMDITNDEDAWVTNTLSFTASNTFIVIYVRSLGSVDGNTEVFYDNISLKEDATASINDVLASKVSVYPNPAKNFLAIEAGNVDITSVSVFNILGSKVLEQKELVDNKLNVSSLESGVYLLKISGDNAVATKKFIVE